MLPSNHIEFIVGVLKEMMRFFVHLHKEARVG
jgi:hypothetical protein